MQNTNRIIFNTMITYGKSAITIVISLYSTRLVLNALGAEDFGLFSVIGGLVGMLSFLNAAMTTSTQRYISFNLGKGNLGNVKKVFANSSILHYAIGVFLVLLIEIVGLYFINTKLEINPERLWTANWLFHFVVISTFITIISVPYDAVVNAHENMLFLAVIGVSETLLKLGIAIYLVYSNEDKLLVYGLLTMISAIAIRIIKRLYSRRKYLETHVSLRSEYDKKEIKELSSFAGWNLLGVMCYIGRNQGIAVVLNLFFSTAINAAYGIANQVNGQLSFFSATVMQAMQPQMVKSEGSGDRNRLITLAIFSSKISFFLFAFISFPIYMELPLILKFWLNNVPEGTVLFCRLIILLTLTLQLRNGITTATHAIGSIKTYQLINSPIQLLTLPLGYLLFKYNYPAYSIIIISLCTEGIVLILSIFFFEKLTGYSALTFFRNVLIPCLAILFINYLIINLLSNLSTSYLYKAVIFSLTSVLYLVLVFFIGFNRNERDKSAELFLKLKYKLHIKV